jgi:hypothetical protein
MLYNDMIGNSLSSGTRLSNNTKRVFSETIPYLETEDEAKMRKATNSDNGPSRQLARYIKTATEQYVPQLEVELVYRNDRFTWWRSYSFAKWIYSYPYV